MEPSPLGSAKGHSLSWVEFLHSCIGIRHRLRLTSPGPSKTRSLTPTCDYVRKNKPDKLVGLLQYCWVDEKDAITGSKEVLEILRNATVLCANGEPEKLCDTILPLPGLLKLCGWYIDSGDVPFLAMDSLPQESDLQKWIFLKESFGVTVEGNFNFHLEVMKAMGFSDSSSEKVYQLLEMIYTQWKQSIDIGRDKNTLQYELLTNSHHQTDYLHQD